MSARERYGYRELDYSAFHRPKSISRFVSDEYARSAFTQDIDAIIFVEYNDQRQALALIETARDVGQSAKNADVLVNIAKRSIPQLQVWTFLYSLSTFANPADYRFLDIKSFRAKRQWPDPMKNWAVLDPSRYVKLLVDIRAAGIKNLNIFHSLVP